MRGRIQCVKKVTGSSLHAASRAPSELMTRAVGTNHQIIGPVSGGGAAPPAFTPEYEHELRSLREASEFMLSQLESRINGWEEAEEEVRIWQDRAEALQERLQKSNSEFSMLKEQLERATKEIQERSDRQLADLTMEVAIKRTKLFEAYEKMATMKRQQDILFECIKEVSSMFQTIGGEDVKVLRQDLNFDFFDIQPLAHKLLFDATAENFVEITPYLDNLMQQGYILKQYIQRRSVDINNSHLELAVSLKTLTELDHSLSILVGEGRPDNKDVPDQNPAGSIEGSLSTLRAYAKKLWNIMDEAEHRLDLVEEMMDNLAAASQNRSATQSGLLERTQFLVAQQQELKMLEHNAMNDERVQLREVIESRDSEIRDLRSKLARLADENSSVQFQIRMRELGAKHQEVANSSAQTSQKQAETNAKSIEREVHRLKDANSKLQRQIEEHNLQNSFNEEKLRLQLSVLQDKEEIFQTEKASLTSQIQLLEARNKQLHADSKRALKEFSDLKASFTEQNHMYAVSSNTLAEQIADLQMNVHGKVLEISVLKAEAEQMLSEFSKKIEDERVEKEQLKQMMKDVKDITMKLEDDVCDFMPEMQPEVLAQKHQLPEKEGNNADLSVITSLKRLGSNVTAHLTKLSQDNVRLQSELQEAISAGLVESRRSAERVSVSDKCAEEVKMAGVVLGDLFKIALQEIFEMDALAKELEQETKAHQALLSEMHECVLQNERETTANSMVSKCSSGGEGIQTACEDIDMTGALVENISFQTIEVPTFFEAEREESDTNQPVHKTPQEEMRGSIAIFPRVLPRARALPVRPRSSYAQTRSLSPRSPRVRKHAHAEEIAETQNIDTYVLRRGGQASRLDTSEANDAEKEDLSSFQSADVRAVTCDPVIERVGSPLALRTLKGVAFSPSHSLGVLPSIPRKEVDVSAGLIAPDHPFVHPSHTSHFPNRSCHVPTDDEGQGDLVPQQTAGNVRAAQSTSVHSASTANIRNLPQPKAQSRGASVRDWISPFPPKIKHDSDRGEYAVFE
jgi:hypothetical protein